MTNNSPSARFESLAGERQELERDIAERAAAIERERVLQQVLERQAERYVGTAEPEPPPHAGERRRRRI